MLRTIALSTTLVIGLASVSLATEDNYESRDAVIYPQTSISAASSAAATPAPANEDHLTSNEF